MYSNVIIHCSNCHMPLQVPPGAGSIRCALNNSHHSFSRSRPIMSSILEHLLDVEEHQQQHVDFTKPKFQIKNLTKDSDDGKIHILKGITVDVPKGVVVGIIGPSGSGKSTLLRALNRLWEPPSSIHPAFFPFPHHHHQTVIPSASAQQIYLHLLRPDPDGITRSSPIPWFCERST